jgi:hypothetical protein
MFISLPSIGLSNLRVTFGWWLFLGLTFGIIEAVSWMRLNLDFVYSKKYSDEVKMALLQVEHDKWKWALTLFTTIFLAVGVSGLLTIVIGTTDILVGPWSFVYLVVFSYGTVGLALGVYGNVFGKINRIDTALLEIKRSHGCGLAANDQPPQA